MTSASSVLERFIAKADADRLGAYGVHVLIGSDEGILSLETSVPELLPSMELGAGVDAVRVRHLLTMTSGIDNPQRYRCPLGWIVGGSGLELRTDELAHIGR